MMRPASARRAVSAVFFINGAVLASWVPHIPAVKEQHGFGDGQLGLALLAMAVGAVLMLPLAGWLVGRLGSHLMTSLAALGFCLALPLPLLSPNGGLLVLSLALLGAANGMLDVSMNAQAVEIERGYGRPIMSSFHGLFSLGGVAGAVLASVAMWLGVGNLQHVIGVALLSSLAVAGALPALAPSGPRARIAEPVLARPDRAMLHLGLLAFFGLLAEGAMADWSAVYLRHTLATSPALAATSFAAFSLAMAAGRLAGDWLVGWLGGATVLRASGTIAALGLGTALLMGWAPGAIVGFGLVGFGIANTIPIVFSAAARALGAHTGRALAAVAATGYLGFLAGPPLIGLVAELTGLPFGLAIVSVCCGLIAVGAGTLTSPGAALGPRRSRWCWWPY